MAARARALARGIFSLSPVRFGRRVEDGGALTSTPSQNLLLADDAYQDQLNHQKHGRKEGRSCKHRMRMGI